MSTPQGHPDFQSYAQTRSLNLFPAFTQTLPPGITATPIVPVASWQSAQISVRPSAGTAKVTIFHYVDAAGTLIAGADTWTVTPTCFLDVLTLLRGQYVQLSINVTSAGNLTAITYGVVGSAPATRISFPVGNQTAGTTFDAVAASAVNEYQMSRICAGRANWLVQPLDATAKLVFELEVKDELNNLLYLFDSLGSPTGPASKLTEVPDGIVSVRVTNTDGAGPHQLRTRLLVAPQ